MGNSGKLVLLTQIVNVGMSTETIGSKLRQLRIENQFSLRKVAAMLDIDVAILSKMERGQRRLSKEAVRKLARIYNYNADELIVLYLSDKVIRQVGDEEFAGKALMVAEEQIAYSTSRELDRTSVLKTITSYLRKNENVSKAWVFGSFARGENDVRSDVDLIIRVPQDRSFSLFDLAEIQHQIELLVHLKIDLVMENGISKEIKDLIMPDMMVIYER
jgi:predicted nucleotidyltransferase